MTQIPQLLMQIGPRKHDRNRVLIVCSSARLIPLASDVELLWNAGGMRAAECGEPRTTRAAGSKAVKTVRETLNMRLRRFRAARAITHHVRASSS